MRQVSNTADIYLESCMFLAVVFSVLMALPIDAQINIPTRTCTVGNSVKTAIVHWSHLSNSRR